MKARFLFDAGGETRLVLSCATLLTPLTVYFDNQKVATFSSLRSLMATDLSTLTGAQGGASLDLPDGSTVRIRFIPGTGLEVTRNGYVLPINAKRRLTTARIALLLLAAANFISGIAEISPPSIVPAIDLVLGVVLAVAVIKFKDIPKLACSLGVVLVGLSLAFQIAFAVGALNSASATLSAVENMHRGFLIASAAIGTPIKLVAIKLLLDGRTAARGMALLGNSLASSSAHA